MFVLVPDDATEAENIRFVNILGIDQLQAIEERFPELSVVQVAVIPRAEIV